MKKWIYALVLALSLSMVSSLNGFSNIKDYAKNGFGVPGDVWLVTPEVEKLMGASEGPQVVVLSDIDKGLLIPDAYTVDANGLVDFTHQVGTFSTWALEVESHRPQNSWYGSSALMMPTTPQLAKMNMPFRPTYVKPIDMMNRGGRYSYEGQYGLSRQWIKAWKFVPFYK